MAPFGFAQGFQHKILTFVTLVGLLAVGGCSSTGLNARYEDYGGYADYGCGCPSAYLNGHLSSCRLYEPYPGDAVFYYQPPRTEAAVEETIVEQTAPYQEEGQRYKAGRSYDSKEKPVRKSGRQNVSLKERRLK